MQTAALMRCWDTFVLWSQYFQWHYQYECPTFNSMTESECLTFISVNSDTHIDVKNEGLALNVQLNVQHSSSHDMSVIDISKNECEFKKWIQKMKTVSFKFMNDWQWRQKWKWMSHSEISSLLAVWHSFCLWTFIFALWHPYLGVKYGCQTFSNMDVNELNFFMMLASCRACP